jgi:fatty acid amide hydrolase 2
MPAFFNGVFGHKPTGGLVPGTGQYPIAANQALRFLITGPITRCAEDLMPLLRVLAGPDGEDAGCKAFTLGDPAAVDMGQVRVVVIPGDGLHPVTPDLRRAQQRAAQTLRELGAHVEERTLPSLRWAIPIWSSMLQAAGGASFSELLGNGQPVSALHELKLWVRGQSTHTFPAIGLAGLESVTKRFPAGLDQMVRRGQALKQELLDLMGPQGVILFPPHPRPAPRHHEPILRPFSYIFTAIFNVMELPATQVPMGLNPRGLPLGVQVVGAHGNDHLTIRVAMELERRHGGWVPPPLPDH